MTLDQQTQKEFQIICPKWAELLETYKFNVLVTSTFCQDNLCKTRDSIDDSNPKTELCLNNSLCCVLGEAHGFKEFAYGDCDECGMFSMDFFNAENEKEFEKIVPAFIKHFKIEHEKIYQSKVKPRL